MRAILGLLPAGWLYSGLNFSGSRSSTLSRTRWYVARRPRTPAADISADELVVGGRVGEWPRAPPWMTTKGTRHFLLPQCLSPTVPFPRLRLPGYEPPGGGGPGKIEGAEALRRPAPGTPPSLQPPRGRRSHGNRCLKDCLSKPTPALAAARLRKRSDPQ